MSLKEMVGLFQHCLIQTSSSVADESFCVCSGLGWPSLTVGRCFSGSSPYPNILAPVYSSIV
jgi:hypothetical protein